MVVYTVKLDYSDLDYNDSSNRTTTFTRSLQFPIHSNVEKSCCRDQNLLVTTEFSTCFGIVSLKFLELRICWFTSLVQGNNSLG